MPTFQVHTDLLFDPKKKEFVKDISITIDPNTGLITEVHQRKDELPDSIEKPNIDLRGKVVCPGFVDAHTHIFLHAYNEAPSVVQKRDESFVERIEADANIRDAINRGLTPGPRLFVATRVIASTAAYEPRTENHLGGTCMPAGCDSADGPDELRKAVRRRIGHGADVIKFYADYYRRVMRFPPKQQHPYIPSMKFQPVHPNPDLVVFQDEEMNAIVSEAKLACAPAIAHADSREGVLAAARAGVLSIEHASRAGEDGLSMLKEKGIIFVPTMAIFELILQERFDRVVENLQLAHKLGVRLACGGDTGTFPHGENAREMEIFIEAGISVEDTLEAGTVGGWEACGGDLCGRRFGWFETGCAADIIALDTDPRVDPKALRKVSFVMKDGRIWKENHEAVDLYSP
ncbi:uncharacterized protein IL334_004481 [Kwoniella shivajii]|uniref:Amidohydrolase-related domain-containing protein n=1 Tax=Kwoniella shivajii TaxID=564305 RepID=A0ABZ1D0F1_9TREE|nr:hypothetical protein IL334_004481 [Kwoniella shivajii]